MSDFKYKHIRHKTIVPGANLRVPSLVEKQAYSGIIDGVKATHGEENLYRAAYAKQLVTSHFFRMAVGAPRNMPGWKELDFLFVTNGGRNIAVQVKDYEFVHHGAESGAQDAWNDMYMVQELQKQGVQLEGNKIISISALDVDTFEEAKVTAERILA